jgi:hypothetical protein
LPAGEADTVGRQEETMKEMLIIALLICVIILVLASMTTGTGSI